MATRQRVKPKNLVVVRSSAIHGRGLFALRPIPEGTLIGEYEGRKTHRNGAYTLWLEDQNGDPHGISGTNELRFINHSKIPNVSFYEAELYALRDIRKGEEITHHYGADWDILEPVDPE